MVSYQVLANFLKKKKKISSPKNCFTNYFKNTQEVTLGMHYYTTLVMCSFVSAGKNLKKADNKVHSQHLLFVVCYVTFRGAYSVALTFTVLLLLIHYTSR